MNEIKAKIKRNGPLLKIRKSELDRENLVLGQIRQSKIEAIGQLKNYQRQYVEGVEKLNELRISGDLGTLMNLESTIDYVKAKWYQSLKDVRKIEDDEKQQLQVVIEAQQKLRTIEILDEKYVTELRIFEDKVEQKQLDEIAVQRHHHKAS